MRDLMRRLERLEQHSAGADQSVQFLVRSVGNAEIRWAEAEGCERINRHPGEPWDDFEGRALAQIPDAPGVAFVFFGA